LDRYWFNFVLLTTQQGVHDSIVLRHCVTSWKFVRLILDGVTGMESFIDIILPAALWP